MIWRKNIVLQVNDVISAYEYAELTPVLVVLGGSHAFNHYDGERDYDYFGYHIEDTERPPTGVITKVKHEIFGTFIITSYPINQIMPMIFNKNHPILLNNTFTDWLCGITIFESPLAISIRNDITSLLTTYSDAILDALEDVSKMYSYNGGKSEMPIKIYNRAKRLYLTALHFKKTGQFNCDFISLNNEYGKRNN